MKQNATKNKTLKQNYKTAQSQQNKQKQTHKIRIIK